MSKTCTLCDKPLTWKNSAKGKHVVGECPEHGFVSIQPSPIYAQTKQYQKKPSLLKRIFGRE